MNEFIEVALGDHELARYLRKKGAIDNWHHISNCVTWYNGKGEAEAIAIFHNSEMTRRVWIRKGEKE